MSACEAAGVCGCDCVWRYVPFGASSMKRTEFTNVRTKMDSVVQCGTVAECDAQKNAAKIAGFVILGKGTFY